MNYRYRDGMVEILEIVIHIHNITGTLSVSKEASYIVLIHIGDLMLFLKVSHIPLRSRASDERYSSIYMTKRDSYRRQLLACSDNVSQYFTVTAEKEAKHISVRFINSIPHRGRFIASSSAAMYLKNR
jgi:hypothetical protein